VSVLTRKEAVPPLHSAWLLRRDSLRRIWLLVRKLDQLVARGLVLLYVVL